MQARKQNRLFSHDYAAPGYYFVTTCVQDRKCYFGEIQNSEMHLNQYGKIAEQAWKDIPKFYSAISLDVFVFMPNHLHGLIVIQTDKADSIRPYTGISLSKVVGYYKQFVTKQLHRVGLEDFAWQKSFYDHIVRSEESLDKI